MRISDGSSDVCSSDLLCFACMARPLRPRHNSTKEKTMPIGTVKFFNLDKGYGFIQPEGSGNDAFVHISAVERAGMTTLNKDQSLSYDLENDQRGKASAVNLKDA